MMWNMSPVTFVVAKGIYPEMTAAIEKKREGEKKEDPQPQESSRERKRRLKSLKELERIIFG